MKKEDIADILDNLLKHEEFLACMVINRDKDYITPTHEKNDIGIKKIINDLKQITDGIFKIVDCYSEVKLKQMKWRFTNFDIRFRVFPDFYNILIAVVPKLSNEGLIEVELEKAYRKILETNKAEIA